MDRTVSPLSFSLIIVLSLLSLDSDASSDTLNALDLPSPIVIELFTSQSCSSCPPADQVLGELAQNPNVIALACHVTYWNHLNWKDTLSRSFCTDRQRRYASKRGSSRVYTPQMVVNGTAEFIGSRRNRVAQEIDRSTPALLPIKIKQTTKGTLTITLPALKNQSQPLTLWLMHYQSHHTQSMKSGENRGRTIDYTNAVQVQEKVGIWTGESKVITLNISSKVPAHGYAVLAQQDEFGPILAAGKLLL
ncbi:MAG: DUF1223 domain-containing protein [Rhodospirillaceae bacterium]|nr:MAG: DUF1223 domain-containing protein [Rhodospirillaceae bacterium]